MSLEHPPRLGRSRPIPILLAAVCLAVLPLHASAVGPVPETAVVLAIVLASTFSAVECVLGDYRVGCLLTGLTLSFYFLFAYPLSLLPEQRGLFHAIYIIVAILAVALSPVLLLKRHYIVAMVSLAAAAILFAFAIP